jgi:inorganic pyrophosphatase
MGKTADTIKKKTLASPVESKPFAKKGEVLKVVIETPKASRNKYAYDPDQRVFMLKNVLPAGMYFPYDFGFVPRTEADDGDPVDVMVLMDEPAFAGCVLECRVIGAILGEQEREDGRKERNDRVIAVETKSHLYAEMSDIDDLPSSLTNEVAEFFVNYHRLERSKFRVLSLVNAQQARALVSRHLRAA